jgi:succinyl-CoA synthetase beta subunit
MNLHEYQAKELLSRYRVKVPRGKKVESVAEALEAAESLGYPVVVKAQIHAGGRGKAGGVKLARTRADVEKYAGEILGKKLVTPQTGPEGKEVRKLLIEEGVGIDRELYLSFLIDRASGWPVAIASQSGGMEIEKVAAETPEKILRAEIDPAVGMRPHQARRLAFELGLSGDAHKNAVSFLLALYQAFRSLDASLVEINPLLVTKEKEVLALDAKVSLDDNALYRHPDLAELRDAANVAPQERLAGEKGLAYVKLEGDIGILGNGAGLVMSTLDVVAQAGGRPANFCDVGGGANADVVVGALEVITADPVRAILFNIFGGITRGGEVATGLLEALDRMAIDVPIVVRIDGTEADAGRRLIAEAAKTNVHVEETMLSAAQRVVELAGSAS